MTLTIDTSDQEKAIIQLVNNSSIILKKKLNKIYSSQILLPLIDEILKESKYDIRDISDISVFTGPGSYMGIRVGVTVAQIFGLLLGISVNNKKAGEKIQIIYQNDHFQ
jgi:tRNA threonylcarbamoyladenosine biosynthesis protein TsaB